MVSVTTKLFGVSDLYIAVRLMPVWLDDYIIMEDSPLLLCYWL
jgi:hypothetical protein